MSCSCRSPALAITNFWELITLSGIGRLQNQVWLDFECRAISRPRFPSFRPNSLVAQTCVKLKLPARPCATYRGRLCPVGRVRGASVIQDWIEVRWPNLCDGHPFIPVMIPVTSPEFHRKIAQQKRHCRAKPTHNTQGVVWPTSKAWQGILRSCRHFIWQLAHRRHRLPRQQQQSDQAHHTTDRAGVALLLRRTRPTVPPRPLTKPRTHVPVHLRHLPWFLRFLVLVTRLR